MSWIDNRPNRWLSTGILVLLAIFLSGTSFNVTAMTSLSRNEMSDVTGQQGFNVDVDLDVVIDRITFTDADGFSGGTSGDIQFGEDGTGRDVILDNGSGGSASLTGMTIDADGGTNQIIFGGPSGTFTIRSETIFLGGTTNNTFNTRVDDIDVSNTNVYVGAN